MQEYEIRILRSPLRPSVIFKAFYRNDADAIRTARLLAAGRAIEIWCEIACIHRAPKTQTTDRAA